MGWNQAERDGNLQKSTSWNTERDQQTPIAPLPHCPIVTPDKRERTNGEGVTDYLMKGNSSPSISSPPIFFPPSLSLALSRSRSLARSFARSLVPKSRARIKEWFWATHFSSVWFAAATPMNGKRLMFFFSTFPLLSIFLLCSPSLALSNVADALHFQYWSFAFFFARLCLNRPLFMTWWGWRKFIFILSLLLRKFLTGKSRLEVWNQFYYIIVWWKPTGSGERKREEPLSIRRDCVNRWLL